MDSRPLLITSSPIPSMQRMYSHSEGGRLLTRCVENKAPFIVASIPMFSLEILGWYMKFRMHRQTQPRLAYNTQPMMYFVQTMLFYPVDIKDIDVWAEMYLNSLRYVDVAVERIIGSPVSEAQIIHEYATKARRILPRTLMSVFETDLSARWTFGLQGRVGIVSPRADMLYTHMKHQRNVWSRRATFIPIVVTYEMYEHTGLCCTSLRRSPWDAIIWEMVEIVLLQKVKIVLIDCGAYSLILAARLKDRGISSICIGDDIEVLFGVRDRMISPIDEECGSEK